MNFMVCATVVDQAIYIPLERHKALLVCHNISFSNKFIFAIPVVQISIY